jgi:hypothetical protein
MLFYIVLFCLCSSLRNTFNFNNGSITGRNGLEARSRRHRLWQELNVDFVHGGEVFHIGKVDIVLDDLLKRRSRELKDFFEVLQNGPLY